MKKLLIAVVLVLMLVIMVGCDNTAKIEEKSRVTNAIIRYFDGSSEMVQLKSVNYSRYGYVMMETVYGQKIDIGWNNVILIEEDEEDQFNE